MDKLNSYSFEQLVNLASGKIKQNGGGSSSCRKCKHGGDGYTNRKVDQIHHDHLIKDFIGIEKLVFSYLND